ncbi:MAG: hypothetical protein M1814_001088 [Vezdaea aestivalis]|nr:MAG: hypothetical protein M1814_001088 [Vezdaea aestivalis]
MALQHHADRLTPSPDGAKSPSTHSRSSSMLADAIKEAQRVRRGTGEATAERRKVNTPQQPSRQNSPTREPNPPSSLPDEAPAPQLASTAADRPPVGPRAIGNPVPAEFLRPITYPAPAHTGRPVNLNACRFPRRGRQANMNKIEGTAYEHLLPFDENQNTWLSVDVRAINIPSYTTTLDLWRTFSVFGNIESIDLYETNRLCNARIRFSPPPKEPLDRQDAKGPVTVIVYATGRLPPHRPRLVQEKANFSFTVPSPVRENVTYPETITIKGSQIDFGIMLQPQFMMIREQVKPPVGQTVTIALKLGRRRVLDVQFALAFKADESEQAHTKENCSDKYRLQIPLLELTKVVRVDDYSSSISLIMTLSNPPCFYRQLQDVSPSHNVQTRRWLAWDSWYRQTDVVFDPQDLKNDPISLRKPRAIIDLGRWTTYKLTFDRGFNPESKINMFLSALADYNVQIETVTKLPSAVTRKKLSVWDYIDQSNKPLESSASALSEMANIPPLPFPVRYQLEVCISQGVLNEYNMTKDFVDRLLAMEERQATELLEFIAYKEERIFNPMEIFDMRITKGSHTKAKIPSYCTYSRKATVTPTMVYYTTPNVETSNRVVREFSHMADRFLRVQFTDERNEGSVRASNKPTTDEVFTRIKRTMTNGITIGDRHFEFLAFGNSQFREQGAFFFCPTSSQSTDSIRRWMGNFQHIKVVAKHAARFGQCFSTTRAVTGTKVSVLELEEVIHGKYTFTDGVGKMSPFIAQIVQSDLKLPTDGPPSVIQFRLGGSKGVLAIDPSLRQRQVRIRKSQYKFKAIFNGLEVIRWSHFATAKLNRQLILILSDLGVEDKIFLQKQTDMLERLQRAMHDEQEAVSMMQKNVDPNGMTPVIAGMILSGFMTANDPFILSLLHLWRSWCIKYLKEKAHILIEKSAFLLGCTDETKTLKGHFDKLQTGPLQTLDMKQAALPEIFVQISHPTRQTETVIIEGLCLVGRNPSLHPGDLRVVNAVNVPKLHHLRDVVVFPQTGDRDLPSMCSGGDLDGDEFFVVWDPDLLPKEWNHAPMDYTALAPVEAIDGVTIDAITSFFIQYIKNDSLPIIAHAHMAQADFQPAGSKSQECLMLAQLHSTAVDYVKTGRPATMPRNLAPRRWPHFMEKRGKSPDQIYISRKILGQLYDQVEKIDFIPQYSAVFDERVLSLATPDPEQVQQATEIKVLYDSALRRILAQHSIKTEFEVWSTFVMSHSNTKKDYKFHEEMGELSGGLKDRFRSLCVDAAGGKHHSKIGPFVLAMYTATRNEFEAAKAEHRDKESPDGTVTPDRPMTPDSMPLISFAWLFPEALGKLVDGNFTIRQGPLPVPVPETHSPTTLTKSAPQARTVAEAVTSSGLVQEGNLLGLFEDHSPGSETSQSPASSPTSSSPDFDSLGGGEQMNINLPVPLRPQVSNPPRLCSADVEAPASGAAGPQIVSGEVHPALAALSMLDF